MLRPGSLALTLLLGLLTGMGPLSVDMYLASLPDMGRLLAAPPSQVQLTISFYLLGFAIAQVFYGPLSDRHGRKPVLLAALAVYLIATLGCALATSIEMLIVARFVQAVGASGAIVLARAVVRDMYDGARIGRELSRMASIMALAPLAAPLAGGLLQTAFGWRSNFVALLCYGLAATGMVWLLLPETLRQRAPEPVSPVSILRSYRRFLGDRGFVVHLGIAICCMAGLFAWISTAAFILQDIYGLSALAFGFTFAIASSGYLVGTLIGARTVVRWGGGRTMGAGTAGMAAGGIGTALAVALGAHEALALVLAVGLYMVGMGMAWPQAQAGALIPFPDRAGAASSLLGFLTQTNSAIVGAVLGHSLGGTAWPFAIAAALAGCGAMAMWALTRNVRANPSALS
jgi:DHA1 family bicyclomycin/chloramphenicol resistance-like MFS transporter